MNPQDLLYAKSHEWASIATDDSGQKVATIGLSKFALELLTDLVFIELNEEGEEVEAGDRIGEVESVKTVSDLYSPVTGEIIEVNADIADQLDDLSNDPYEAGWLMKIRITDDSSLGELMDIAAYETHCEEEEH